MKLRQLRDVAAIADHGSIRAAARHLGTAQPTLTRSLADLERELGAPLFERRARGLLATPLGQVFLGRANTILNEVRRAGEEFRQARDLGGGGVAIGLSIAAHLALLPKSLGAFRQRYPHARLHIIEGFYPTLETGLKDGSVDFYVGPDPGPSLPSSLQKETLLAGRRAVLCRRGHPLSKAQSLKELSEAEWITTSITPRAESELGELFAKYGLPEPKLALQCQSALTLITCLGHSDLLAMAPAQWAHSPFTLLTTISVREELAAAPLIAVTRSDSPLTPAALYLLDLMRRAAGHAAAKPV